MPKKTANKILGNQTPTIDIYEPGDTRKAELLIVLMEEYGYTFLDWQKLVLRRWLAEDESGNFVNLECGLSVPRQNGKSILLVARVIYGIIFRKAKGLYTAQQEDTANEIKERVQDFFYENDHEEIFNLLTPRFRKKPKNYDFIEFESGAKYQFKTRTRLGGLGKTLDELLLDEAADVLDSHQSTLMPTISASRLGNPQLVYAGTPPMAETVGTVFNRIRSAKLEGGKGAWTEWGVNKFTDRSDQEAWIRTNPSYGYFLLPSAVETESTSMPADDFNRMRLGWWSGLEDKRAIKQKDWDELFTEKPEFDDTYKPVFAIKFPPDRSPWALAGAKRLTDDRVHVEVIMSRPIEEGYSRLTKWLLEHWREASKIIIDGSTGAPILYEDLTHSGIPPKRIVLPNMKEVVAAHQFMRDAIDRQELSHYNQPLLNQTIRITKERAFGRYGGFGWDSMSKNLSTAPLDAATYSLWGQRVFSKKRSSLDDGGMTSSKWNQILSNL